MYTCFAKPLSCYFAMSVRKQQNSLGKRKAEDLEEIGQDVAYLKRLFQRDTVPIETMEDFQDPWDLYTEPQHVHQQPLPYRKRAFNCCSLSDSTKSHDRPSQRRLGLGARAAL